MTTLRDNAQIGIGGLRYLAILTISDYTNPSKVVPFKLYFSNMPYMQRTSSGSDYYYKAFDPRIISPLNLNETMFAAGQVAGVVRPDSGSMRLANSDGALDYLLEGYAFDQKFVEIRMLRGISATDEVEDHPVVYKGRARAISATEDSIEIVIGDNLISLDREFPPSVVDGQRVPVTLGKVFNVEPILVAESANEYQVNDGAVTSIDAVYVGGELQTLTTDYTVSLSTGKFTMTSTPTGVVTADVTNDITHGGYTNGAGVILYEMATDFAGMTSGITSTSYTTAAANAYEHGIYVKEKTTIIEAMNRILESVNGILYQDDGLIEFKVIEVPTSAPGSDPITDDDILDIEILPTQHYGTVFAYINYKQNYRVLSENELGASPADREFVTKEWRSKFAAYLPAQFALSKRREIVVNSTITNATDAQTEATARGAFYNNFNRIYRVRMKLNPLYLKVGGACEIRCNRFGLSSGKFFLILSKFEDLEVNEVTLEVWG